MQYDVETPEDYLSQLEDDWRRNIVHSLREIIVNKGPELEESIHYKMLGYGLDGRYAMHLNAQKGYVSLYVGNIARIDGDGSMLEGLNLGKGCIRFSKSKNVADTRIDEFIEAALKLWRDGIDMEC